MRLHTNISEDNAILSNYFAQTFSEQFRKYPEIKPTYLLQAGEYLLLDTGLQKVLKTVKHYQQQDNKTKMDFISILAVVCARHTRMTKASP